MKLPVFRESGTSMETVIFILTCCHENLKSYKVPVLVDLQVFCVHVLPRSSVFFPPLICWMLKPWSSQWTELLSVLWHPSHSVTSCWGCGETWGRKAQPSFSVVRLLVTYSPSFPAETLNTYLFWRILVTTFSVSPFSGNAVAMTTNADPHYKLDSHFQL